MNPIIIVNGEKEFQLNNDVKIIFPMDDGGELHLTVNHEGLITDIIRDGEVSESAWHTLDDLIDYCH